MPTTRLILVRHGQTEANREFRYIGSRDDVLTELGQEQAREIARALSSLPIVAVYSSPRRRAYDTALPIADGLGLTVKVVDGLCECDFGSWEGLSRAEVLVRGSQEAEHLLAWERDMTIAPPGGESLEAMHKRVSATIKNLAQEHPDQTIVLVSHVGPIKAVLCAALDAPILSAFRIFLDPATISVVDWRPTSPVVRLVNSHIHLGWQKARWMVGT
jgi:broad specificity phosphatase PhoE